jgi:hypothetical protein
LTREPLTRKKGLSGNDILDSPVLAQERHCLLRQADNQMKPVVAPEEQDVYSQRLLNI